MAQKLLLFWRKPARRCWWEGIELEHVDGVEGRLKVWIRRVWTLEMVCVPSSEDQLSCPSWVADFSGRVSLACADMHTFILLGRIFMFSSMAGVPFRTRAWVCNGRRLFAGYLVRMALVSALLGRKAVHCRSSPSFIDRPSGSGMNSDDPRQWGPVRWYMGVSSACW